MATATAHSAPATARSTTAAPRPGPSTASSRLRGPLSLKDLANTGIYKATGYKLVNVERLRTRQAPRARPPAGALPAHYDDAAKKIIRAVRARSMTSHLKLYALVLATRHVADHGIPGAVVECGVWRGGSMQAVAHALLERGAADRELHLYDTFEGMTEPTEADRAKDGTPAAELLARSPRTARIWAE